MIQWAYDSCNLEDYKNILNFTDRKISSFIKLTFMSFKNIKPEVEESKIDKADMQI